MPSYVESRIRSIERMSEEQDDPDRVLTEIRWLIRVARAAEEHVRAFDDYLTGDHYAPVPHKLEEALKSA